MPDSAAPPRSGSTGADRGEGADPAGTPVTRRAAAVRPSLPRGGPGRGRRAVRRRRARSRRPRGARPRRGGGAAVVAWNLAYLWVLLPDGRPVASTGRPAASTSSSSAGCAWPSRCWWIRDTRSASLGWVSPIASFTVVAVQFQLGRSSAAARDVAVCAAFLVGAAASPGLTVVDGLLAGGAAGWPSRPCSRGCCGCCCSARARGRPPDAGAVRRRARRRDRRCPPVRPARALGDVHDTSASTLLMIGLGAVRGTEEWLPGQVRRDIAPAGRGARRPARRGRRRCRAGPRAA